MMRILWAVFALALGTGPTVLLAEANITGEWIGEYRCPEQNVRILSKLSIAEASPNEGVYWFQDSNPGSQEFSFSVSILQSGDQITARPGQVILGGNMKPLGFVATLSSTGNEMDGQFDETTCGGLHLAKQSPVSQATATSKDPVAPAADSVPTGASTPETAQQIVSASGGADNVALPDILGLTIGQSETDAKAALDRYLSRMKGEGAAIVSASLERGGFSDPSLHVPLYESFSSAFRAWIVPRNSKDGSNLYLSFVGKGDQAKLALVAYHPAQGEQSPAPEVSAMLGEPALRGRSGALWFADPDYALVYSADPGCAVDPSAVGLGLVSFSGDCGAYIAVGDDGSLLAVDTTMVAGPGKTRSPAEAKKSAGDASQTSASKTAQQAAPPAPSKVSDPQPKLTKPAPAPAEDVIVIPSIDPTWQTHSHPADWGGIRVLVPRGKECTPAGELRIEVDAPELIKVFRTKNVGTSILQQALRALDFQCFGVGINTFENTRYWNVPVIYLGQEVSSVSASISVDGIFGTSYTKAIEGYSDDPAVAMAQRQIELFWNTLAETEMQEHTLPAPDSELIRTRDIAELRASAKSWPGNLGYCIFHPMKRPALDAYLDAANMGSVNAACIASDTLFAEIPFRTQPRPLSLDMEAIRKVPDGETILAQAYCYANQTAARMGKSGYVHDMSWINKLYPLGAEFQAKLASNPTLTCAQLDIGGVASLGAETVVDLNLDPKLFSDPELAEAIYKAQVRGGGKDELVYIAAFSAVLLRECANATAWRAAADAQAKYAAKFLTETITAPGSNLEVSIRKNTEFVATFSQAPAGMASDVRVLLNTYGCGSQVIDKFASGLLVWSQSIK